MQFFMPSLSNHLFFVFFKPFIKLFQLRFCQCLFRHGKQHHILFLDMILVEGLHSLPSRPGKLHPSTSGEMRCFHFPDKLPAPGMVGPA